MTTHKSNEYKSRSDLAHKLTELRGKKRIPFIQKSGKKLAENLLAEQRSTDTYEDNLNRKYAELLKNRDGLPKILNKKVAISLISARGFGNPRASLLVKNIDRFAVSDHKEIAMKMIKYGLIEDLLSRIEYFHGLDYNEIAIKILLQPEKREVFIRYMDKFPSLNSKEIAIYLKANRSGWLVAKNLDKFPGLDDVFVSQIKKDLVTHEEWLHNQSNMKKETDSLERACKKENEIASKIREKKEEEEKAAILRRILFISSC